MKHIQPNEAVRALRKIIGFTQAEFAEMIGVSKDAVVSWETGRNELSATFARRIALVTGVDGRLLRLGIGLPVSQAADAHIYTKEDFERHQQTEWIPTEAAQAERLGQCEDALGLLFRAAMQPGGAPPRSRWPAFLDSFMQWCEQAREDFKLGPEIETQLEQRRFRAGMTQAYRDWRAMARGNPEGLQAAGFQDDPSKDREALRLEVELVPGWAPGRNMKPPRPASMRLVPGRATKQDAESGKAGEGRQEREEGAEPLNC